MSNIWVLLDSLVRRPELWCGSARDQQSHEIADDSFHALGGLRGNRKIRDAQTLAVQTIVNEFFPQARLAADDPRDRRSCYGVLETTSSGNASLIVAGYTNGFSAVARVLGKDASGSFSIFDETPATVNMRGITCEVEFADFDSNGHLDVLLTLDAIKGSESWAFKWSGSGLVNLTPTYIESGRQRSSLIDAALVDVNRDGSLQILTSPGHISTKLAEPMELPYQVFMLCPSGYEHQQFIIFYGTFNVTDDSYLSAMSFVLPQGATAPYTIKIMNGDKLGRHLVGDGSIRLNGVELLSGAKLNDHTAGLDVTLAGALPVDNEIKTILTGSSDAFITIVILDSAQR